MGLLPEMPATNDRSRLQTACIRVNTKCDIRDYTELLDNHGFIRNFTPSNFVFYVNVSINVPMRNKNRTVFEDL